MNTFFANVKQFFAERRKSMMALLALALTWASQKYGATNEYVSAAIGVLGLIGVHQVPNDMNPTYIQNIIKQFISGSSTISVTNQAASTATQSAAKVVEGFGGQS